MFSENFNILAVGLSISFTQAASEGTWYVQKAYPEADINTGPSQYRVSFHPHNNNDRIIILTL